MLGIACADLTSVPLGVCGNGVLDEGEDCDSVPGCGDVGAGACRYVCGQRAIVCPEGWACSEDNICLRPSGCFDPDGISFSIPISDQWALGDVDGDRRADLVVRRDGDLSLFSGTNDGSMTLAFQSTTPRFRGPFSMLDLDDDLRDDLILPIASHDGDRDARPGIQVMLGSPQGLTPVAFSNASIGGRAIDLLGNSALTRERPLVIESFSTEAGAILLELRRGDCPALQFQAQLSERNATGPKAPTVDLGGGETLLALPFEAGIGVFDVPPLGCIGAVSQGLPLPPSKVLREDGLHFAMLPRGPALVAVVFDGAAWSFAVYPFDGRRFSETPTAAPELESLLVPSLVRPEACQRTAPPILAAGDLNGDGISDFVTPDGIFQWGGADYCPLLLRDRGTSWTEGVIGDFDDNGSPDVVAAVASDADDCSRASGLDLALERDGRFGLEYLLGLRAPGFLRSGDFDGDGLDDLALRDGTAADTNVVVLFGSRDRALAERTEVEDLGAISSMVATRMAPTPIGDDRNLDLSVITGRSFPTLTVLEGGSDRRLTAPLYVADPQHQGDDRLRIVAGPLHQIFMTTDVLSYELGPFPYDRSVPATAGYYRLPEFDYSCGYVALGMSDARSAGMVVAVDKAELRGPLARGTPELDECAAAFEERSPRLMIAKEASDIRALDAELMSPFGDCADSRGLSLADLDRDGTVDLLVTVGKYRADPGCADEQVWVLLDPLGEKREVSWLAPDLFGGLSLQQAAALNADGDAALEIAALDGDGVHLLDLEATELLERPLTSIRIERPTSESLPLRRGLLAGDIDGDGLDDLLTIDREAASVHRALPHDDPAVAFGCPD